MNKKLSLLIASVILSVGSAFAALSTSPVTSNATEGATLLYKFLYDNYGKKTISGIMTGDQNSSNLETQLDVAAVKSKSGKYPALVGFDFIMATGQGSDEAWYKDYTNNTLVLSAELWKKGGIPAFCWHWKVADEEGFYAPGKNSGKGETNFDFTKGFIAGTTQWNTTSENYKLLINDIDKISGYFLKLQEQGIAAIWRPVHEAAGGWFWWGSKGAQAYIALYRLIYDRMVNVNGVNNLIWVWNIERDPSIGYDYKALNKAWYPGDDVVDVVGVDIYNDAYDYKSNIESYNKIISEVGSDKILAVTENGPIMDPAKMAADKAVWSWWMPWYESWDGGYASKTSNDEWKSAMADERIITLEDMPGWGTYQEVQDPACIESMKKGIYEVECSSDYVASSASVNNVSGSGALNLKESTDYINLTINLKAKGAYKVYVGYNSAYGYKQVDCSVNGISGMAKLGTTTTDAQKDAMGEALVGTFDFNAGDNLVKITPNWQWAVVDYVRIEADGDAPVYDFKVSDVDGFKVNGAKLLDRCDNEFVMRGVSMAYTWFKSTAYAQLEAIHNHGANAVRIVLADGKKYSADNASAVKTLIEKCKEYNMVAILEVHDETGSDKISDLLDAANYFANMASTLKGTEHYVIINIANEWHYSSDASNWRDGYKQAIPVIRKAGLRHCIMVDAGGYGQSASTIHTYGKEVLAADEDNNVIFSIHMYGSAGNTNKVIPNIDGVINQDLALCIGEFGWYHSDGDVDEEKILSYCKEKNVGWLAWSWVGNGSPVEYLDIVKDQTANPTLASYSDITINNWNNTQSWKGSSDWGKIITDAWKEEAKPATINKCSSVDIDDITTKSYCCYFANEGTELHILSAEDETIKVIGALGKTVFQGAVTAGESIISTRSWTPGLYIVLINGAVVKLIK